MGYEAYGLKMYWCLGIDDVSQPEYGFRTMGKDDIQIVILPIMTDDDRMPTILTLLCAVYHTFVNYSEIVVVISLLLLRAACIPKSRNLLRALFPYLLA